MECKFYVGQKVVCVDDGVRHTENGSFLPRPGHEIYVGNIYTVCGFATSITGRLNVVLSELPKPNGYTPDHFRPAVETKTDISALKQIVADVFGGKVKEAV